jgi:sec-independent protein translocase protein TatA
VEVETMGELSPWHLLIVAVVFVLLFGARKLPDAARSLGRSMRILKSEVKGLHDDDAPAVPAATAPAAVTAAPAPATPASAPAADPHGVVRQSV